MQSKTTPIKVESARGRETSLAVTKPVELPSSVTTSDISEERASDDEQGRSCCGGGGGRGRVNGQIALLSIASTVAPRDLQQYAKRKPLIGVSEVHNTVWRGFERQDHRTRSGSSNRGRTDKHVERGER